MTDIRKSDAQLDAEANGRSTNEAVPQPLEHLIATHRDLYRADLWIERLTTETPPVTTDPQTGAQTADPMSMIGPTLSYPLSQYLHASPMFPWTRSYAAMRANCRRTHTRGHLEREVWRGSLCGELVARVIRRDYAFDRACYELGVYDPENGTERAERVFRAALAHIEAKMDDLRQRAEPVVYRGEWPPAPEHRHHVVPGLHEQECEQCRRAA